MLDYAQRMKPVEFKRQTPKDGGEGGGSSRTRKKSCILLLHVWSHHGIAAGIEMLQERQEDSEILFNHLNGGICCRLKNNY